MKRKLNFLYNYRSMVPAVAILAMADRRYNTTPAVPRYTLRVTRDDRDGGIGSSRTGRFLLRLLGYAEQASRCARRSREARSLGVPNVSEVYRGMSFGTGLLFCLFLTSYSLMYAQDFSLGNAWKLDSNPDQIDVSNFSDDQVTLLLGPNLKTYTIPAGGYKQISTSGTDYYDFAIGKGCQGAIPDLNKASKSCLGAKVTAGKVVLTTVDPFFTVISMSKSLNSEKNKVPGADLLFGYAFNIFPGSTTHANAPVVCAPGFPNCLTLTHDWKWGNPPSLAGNPFTIFNGSHKDQSLKYNVVWGDSAHPQTTGSGYGQKSIKLSPFSSQKPSIPNAGRVNAAEFKNLKQKWFFDRSGGMNQLSVSESIDGNPLMYVLHAGNKVIYYNQANTTGKAISSSS